MTTRDLEIGAIVKVDPAKVSGLDVAADAEGRVIGFAGGDYQVLFRAWEGPLWFKRDELVDTGKRGPGAIGDRR